MLNNHPELNHSKALEQKYHLEAILANAAEAIVSINGAGEIEKFNTAAERIFDTPSSDVLGTQFQRLFRDPLPNLSKFDSNKLSPREREIIGLRADGTEFVVEIATSGYEQGGRNVTVGILRDRTLQNRLESRLAQAQKMESIGTLAAGIAHELNTPIQFVNENVNYLKSSINDVWNMLDLYEELVDKLISGESTDNILEAIRDERDQIDLADFKTESRGALNDSLDGTQRMAEIIAALKSFSHPGENSKDPLNINELLEESLVIAHHEYKYFCKVQKDFQSPLPGCLGYKGDLLSTFLNLIVNAAHAIHERMSKSGGDDGLIKIRSYASADWIEVSVKDNGGGIPLEIRDKIFDPFFTTKREGQGTGQGLAIVHSVIVDKHDGRIECISKAGEGTEFIVQLPRLSSN